MLAVFVVVNDDDAPVNTTASEGTLRQALFDADQNANHDDIIFASSLNGAEIQLTEEQIIVSEDVSIRAEIFDGTPLPDGITVVADTDSKIFNVNFDGLVFTGGTKEFEVKGLTLTGINSTSSVSAIDFRG